MGEPIGEVRFVGDLTRVNVQPGDVFVLRCEQHLPKPAIERIHAQFESVMGKGTRLLVLGGGMQLGVVNPGEG